MNTALKSGIDPTSFSSVIRPSSDLFRFVNGPWIDTYSLPDDRSRFGSFDKLADDAETQIRDILEDPETPAAKSSALYSSFLDTESVEAAGMDGIRDDLAAIDGTEDKAQLIRALGRLNPQGGPDLLGIGIYGDPGEPERNIVHIEQSGIALPDEAYYREDRYEAIRQAYQDMVAKLLMLAHYAHDLKDAQSQASRFFDLERSIAACHWDVVETRDQDKTYNPTEFNALQSALSHLDITAWVQAWQQAYDETATARIMPLDLAKSLARTIVHEPSFLTGLDTVWDKAALDDLKLWGRVHTLISWAGYLSLDFEQARFDFYGKVLSGTTEMRPRWKRGVSLVNGTCGEDVGQEYVKRHFPESSKQRMEELVGNLIDAYRVSIRSSEWLGEETKKKALNKLDHFSPKIGYTKHWRDYSALDVKSDASLTENIHAAQTYETAYQLSKVGTTVDKDEWLMNPQTVNAYYEPTMNVIVFPAAILQPPFFDPAAEDAANYGGIGAVIGHEIGHGFDDQGSKYDGEGRLHDWWTEADRKNFEQRTAALIDQYNHFVPAQLAEKYADDPAKAPHVNGALTIGENIGDLGGVNISLKAYAFALDAAAGREKDGSAEGIRQSLAQSPEIEGYTGVQRFFIAYASIWRTKLRDELAEQYLQIDPHSPAEFRTNGIVMNVDLFHEAFSIHEGDEMWLDPDSRVRIW
ncbi:M13 family metallopeptidase [Bifidobacterium psychraerophilum]|uniref:M13 family metallopeptidase n=1 Tax=Bifidobacterium psychraerophilum TaxID=218140 RepID=UPI0023F0B1B4|nr:M13-type metalloendopeptidase [Bifidobacterium psychraerophilum]MCI1660219.1 peptidase M13 [Bifidobacterium psychraerophilum]MCI1805335.1 peptidase M13 [Bifidobacterium psychraerophilum]MCI2176457.1 peptidase M13 [Bifidobacterium psychraerophilum]MCI2181973.1 peptidase M13 [Bifidobacterium psychraerophilum]